MKARWFECPCGIEYWTPNTPLGPEKNVRGCWRCRWWLVRWWMWFVRAGSDDGLFYRMSNRLRAFHAR